MTTTRELITTLALLRVRSGQTQQDVATSTGVSRQAISYIENGKRVPHLDTLIAYADAVGADITITRRRAALPPLVPRRRRQGVSRRMYAAMRGRVPA